MYARIENNVVMELIEFNPEGCFIDEIVKQFVEVPDGVEVKQGYSYSNGTFSAPAQPTLADIKTAKIQEINNAYEQTKTGTFQSTAYDGQTTQNYNCADLDIINALVTTALVNKAGFANEPITYYKDSSDSACIPWNNDSIIKLGLDLKSFKSSAIKKKDSIITYIGNLGNVDDVNNVSWDMELPQSTINPTDIIFDKAKPADVNIELTLNRNNLVSIANGSTIVGFTGSDNIITISQAYFINLTVSQVNLIFNFGANTQTLAVNIIDSSTTQGGK